MSEVCTLPGLPGPRLVYSGTPIGERDEMLCLTDMWRAAGADPSKRPADWQRKEGAAFIEFIAENFNVPNGHIERLIVAERGGTSPGTWAHWQIGMAYAKYLSPEFHMWCNEVVRAHMEGRQLPVQAVQGAITISPADFDRFAERLGWSVIQAARECLSEDVRREVTNATRPMHDRMERLESLVRKRRQPSPKTRETVALETMRQGGKCPCCNDQPVITDGVKVNGAQVDHFHDVGDVRIDNLWLICKDCHDSFAPKGVLSKNDRQSEFDVFQKRRKRFWGEQLKLIA